MRLRILAALSLALLTSACQLSLATDIGVESDGSGRLELAVAVDDELATILADAGADLTLGLAQAEAAAGDWEVEEVDDVAGRELRFRTSFDTPDELGRLVDELHAGLGEGDPAILSDVDLDVAEDGRASFRARAGLALPATTGAVGDGISFDADDLQELLDEQGERAARYDLRLTLPGRPVAHDADVVDGRTLTWHLPVGEMAAIEARAEPAADRTWVLAGAAFLVAAVLAATVVVLARRRHRPRH